MDEATGLDQAVSTAESNADQAAWKARGGAGGDDPGGGVSEDGGDPYEPVDSVSSVFWSSTGPRTPVLNPFDPRPVADDADPAESNDGLHALTGNEIVSDIQANIACVAHCQARIIALIDEAERRDLWAQWVGVKSLPGWVMHIASVSAHTAREYVRVMYALRRMPLVRKGLSDGDLSYSKVREVSRLVDRIPDEDAARLAKVGTGAQVSVVSRNYRKLSAAEESGELPERLPQDDVLICTAGPGRTRIVIDLPEDDAAEIVTMLAAARRIIERRDAEAQRRADEAADGDSAGSSDDDVRNSSGESGGAAGGGGGPRRRERIPQTACLMEIVRAFPHAQSSGAVDLDRARMLVHTSAEVLVRSGAALLASVSDDPDSVPAGTPVDDASAGTRDDDDVPAGTSEGFSADPDDLDCADETCRIDGFGGITGATAQRLACEALVSGIIKDESGDVLRLGRSKRLASRRQRMALSARDVGCQFPGCLARRGCEAHHIRPWSQGGATDLDNLILLCRSHHIAVHEHGLRIVRTTSSFSGALEGAPAFAFLLPDGHQLFACDAEDPLGRVFDTARLGEVVEAVEKATADADPSTLGGGYGFDLGNCVAWMFEAEARHARAVEKAA